MRRYAHCTDVITWRACWVWRDWIQYLKLVRGTNGENTKSAYFLIMVRVRHPDLLDQRLLNAGLERLVYLS